MTIRVAIADDQALVCAGFVSLLTHADDLAVVGEAADGREAVELVRRVRPDVVLMDVRMPRMGGLEATRAIVGDPQLVTVRVVVLTTYELDEYVYEALRAGASGFRAVAVAVAITAPSASSSEASRNTRSPTRCTTRPLPVTRPGRTGRSRPQAPDRARPGQGDGR